MDEALDFEDMVLRVLWRFDEDSEPALFRFRTRRVPGAMLRGRLEVCVFDGHLDLLDSVSILVTVARDAGAGGSYDGIPPPTFGRPAREAKPLRLAARRPVRVAAIRVDPTPGSANLHFTLVSGRGEKEELFASSALTSADIRSVLARLRNFWTTRAVGAYANNLSPGRAVFTEAVDELAAIGRTAWQLLFGRRFASREGASEAIGKLLTGDQSPPDSGIQISFTKDAEPFVFPWSILYPPEPREDHADPMRFWGARFQIEQVIEGPDDEQLSEEPIVVGFILDKGFPHSERHAEDLRRIEAASGGRVRISPPISTSRTLFETLSEAPPAHFYYFFCHGYAPGDVVALRADGLKTFREILDVLPPDSEARGAWDGLLRLFPRMGAEPWIFVGDAEVTESALSEGQFFRSNRLPIVFLNMCHSADVLPSMHRGIVHLFLDKSASAVVGTECPMTSVFADPFGLYVFKELVDGSDIGTALLNGRRHFLSDEMRNPLGLAYTLYGRGTVRLGRAISGG